MAYSVAGSGSDDGGAGSGGEISESGKAKKLKLNASQNETPQESRAGSPVPQGARSFSGSRASSPEGSTTARGKPALQLQMIPLFLIHPFAREGGGREREKEKEESTRQGEDYL